MSCGNPHETRLLRGPRRGLRFLDGELDDEGKHKIREHLDECSPCLRQFGIEQEVKLLVARCCGSDRAPESLRVRIVARLTEVQVDLGHVEYRPE